MRYFFILLPLILNACTIGSMIRGNETEDREFVDLQEVPCRAEASKQPRYYVREKEERAQDFNALQVDMKAAQKRAAAVRAARPNEAKQ